MEITKAGEHTQIKKNNFRNTSAVFDFVCYRSETENYGGEFEFFPREISKIIYDKNLDWFIIAHIEPSFISSGRIQKIYRKNNDIFFEKPVNECPEKDLALDFVFKLKKNEIFEYKNKKYIVHYVWSDDLVEVMGYQGGSMYWYTEKGMYRYSNHWGSVGSNNWNLRNSSFEKFEFQLSIIKQDNYKTDDFILFIESLLLEDQKTDWLKYIDHITKEKNIKRLGFCAWEDFKQINQENENQEIII